jgi:hypothetical protein
MQILCIGMYIYPKNQEKQNLQEILDISNTRISRKFFRGLSNFEIEVFYCTCMW